MRSAYIIVLVFLFNGVVYLQDSTAHEVYLKVWNTALADSIISAEEQVLLDVLTGFVR